MFHTDFRSYLFCIDLWICYVTLVRINCSYFITKAYPYHYFIHYLCKKQKKKQKKGGPSLGCITTVMVSRGSISLITPDAKFSISFSMRAFIALFANIYRMISVHRDEILLVFFTQGPCLCCTFLNS